MALTELLGSTLLGQGGVKQDTAEVGRSNGNKNVMGQCWPNMESGDLYQPKLAKIDKTHVQNIEKTTGRSWNHGTLDIDGHFFHYKHTTTNSWDQALKGKKAVALYFSAHWCPPCRGFTPELAKWYKQARDSKQFNFYMIYMDGSGLFSDFLYLLFVVNAMHFDLHYANAKRHAQVLPART